MIIAGSTTFIEASFTNEDEIEKVVFNNYEYLFGPSSFIIPKALIQTPDGVGAIPDGFAIDLSNRKWYLVEAELLSHSVWNHIAPQITKQIIASQQELTRKLIIEIIVEQYKNNEEIRNKFSEEGIEEINIRKILGEILENKPIVGIPIDKISDDLKQWANNLNSIVKLWTIKKFVDFENSKNIIFEFPEEFRPDIDTEIINIIDGVPPKINAYDVSILDLIESKLLTAGDNLFMTYGPKNAKKQDFKATIQNDGTITVLEHNFKSPSYAALYCINNAGSSRKTVNGWISWKNKDGKLLSELREKYLQMQSKL